MSTETVTMILEPDVSVTTETIGTTVWYNDTELTTVKSVTDGNSTHGVVQNAFIHGQFDSDTPITLYEAFILAEIVMITLELTISITAAIKLPRWKRNYRNQMLMQLSVARFVKRVIFLLIFLVQSNTITPYISLDLVLASLQLYIDFVIVVLVFFFIKHMYDSLIIVVVKISRNNLIRELMWSWCLPLPVCAMWTAATLSGLLSPWMVYLLVCSLFRWPLMFLSICTYVVILYRVMTDKIRKFARCLTVVTFLLCFIINFYLLSTDVIKLWYLETSLLLLVSYISGFLMNLLILSLYIILIILNLNHNNQLTKSRHYSIAIDVK